jgi:hypothetical protein
MSCDYLAWIFSMRLDTIRPEALAVRPAPLEIALSRLFTGAGILLILIGGATATATTVAGAGPFPIAGTIVVIIGYGAFFGNYWTLRNTDRGAVVAFMLKLFLGATSFGLLLAGALNVFQLKDPSIPARLLFADGCIFGVLLIAFHFYTKRSSNRESE